MTPEPPVGPRTPTSAAGGGFTSAGTPPQPAPATRPSSGTAQHVEDGVRTIWDALTQRRGLRVALAGIVVVLVALDVGTGSALGLVLVIAGLAMVVIGAMGQRLRGRLALEFGPDGTSFELQTHLAPPGRRLPPALPGEDTSRPHVSLVPAAGAPALAEAIVVEGSGETVELDVERLRAALAQADAARAAASA